MRQLARRLKDGRLELLDVPDPTPGPGMVVVRLEASVISPGTERATLTTARKGIVAKARARPEQVRQVLDGVRDRGLRETAAAVRQRLEELGPLGYSAAGTVVEAGAETRGLAPGDRVAIAGGGFAAHAEVDVVPALLCASVPHGVESTDAAFATLGAIAINALRRGDAELGRTIAIVGLGLIGQLAVRVGQAAGCRMIGFDPRAEAVELARAGGAEAHASDRADAGATLRSTCDAVLVCAATDSSDPVRLAASLARERGAIVVVGDVGLDLDRRPLYEKELDVRLARSYGPGRYDPTYELHGIDYPIAHARWTEQRNLGAFLDLVADGKVCPAELVTHRFELDAAERAFEALESDEHAVGIVLIYGRREEAPRAERGSSPRPSAPGRPRFGLIGAGSFASSTLIPGLLAAGFAPSSIASSSGLDAETAARRFGFGSTVGDAAAVIDSNVDLVVIATRHDSHAELAAAALRAGKSVYVEKPLALDGQGLREVADAAREADGFLFVGFNRRHAPLSAALRGLDRPRLMTYRVNAGHLPVDHWTNDPGRGGGRLRGECCHFVDFLCDQAASDPRTVSAHGFRSRPELPMVATDNLVIEIAFAGGSVGTVAYAADAPAGPGKERVELTFPGGSATIDDFRRGAVWRGRRRQRLGGRRQDKGFAAEYALLGAIVRGEAEPPPLESFLVSSLATLAAARSLESGRPETVVGPGALATPEATPERLP